MSRYLMPLLFSFAFSLGIIFNSGCGENQQLPKPVCQYGNYIADLGEYLCANVPEIPPEVCTLIHLAKINLAILCNDESTDAEKTEATNSLDNINARLSKAFTKMKTEKLTESQ